MAKRTVSPLQRQLNRVSRRLFMQTLLDTTIWSLSGALAICAVWFFAQPYVVAQPPAALRLWVAGGGLFLGLVVGVLWAVFTAPSRLIAALSLDEKFELRERVTTSLTLTPENAHSPAGQALLADVNARIAKLDVPSQFPVRLTWSSAVVPLLATLLATFAFFYEPAQTFAKIDGKGQSAEVPPNAAAIDKKMEILKKKAETKAESSKPKSEEIEKLEAELEKIANKPRDTKDELRERVKEMTALQEAMQNREKELAEKSKSLRQQLQQLDKTLQKSTSDGPGKELQKALAEGKLDKAAQEIERLAKKLQNNEMAPKEKEQLQKQLEEMQKKLERLSDLKDREEALKKANLDPETLKREMKRLAEDKEKLKELKELASKMGQCQKCLKEGNMDEAMASLSDAAKQLKEMDLDEKSLDDLREQLSKLADAADAAADGMAESRPTNPMNGYSEENPGGIGAGRRPLGEKGAFKSFDAKAKGDFDPKGKKIFDGYVPGQNFKKKSTAEIEGEIKQAAQDAPDAVEQQRIPRAYRDSAKGYFRNLGGQQDSETKKP